MCVCVCVCACVCVCVCGTIVITNTPTPYAHFARPFLPTRSTLSLLATSMTCWSICGAGRRVPRLQGTKSQTRCTACCTSHTIYTYMHPYPYFSCIVMHCIACVPILEDSAISMVGSPIQAANAVSRAPHKHAQKGVPPHVCPSNSAFPGSGTVTIVCPSSPSSVSGVRHRLLRRWQLLCDSRTPSSQVLVLQDAGQGQSNQAGLLPAHLATQRLPHPPATPPSPVPPPPPAVRCGMHSHFKAALLCWASI